MYLMFFYMNQTQQTFLNNKIITYKVKSNLYTVIFSYCKWSEMFCLFFLEIRMFLYTLFIYCYCITILGTRTLHQLWFVTISHNVLNPILFRNQVRVPLCVPVYTKYMFFFLFTPFTTGSMWSTDDKFNKVSSLLL